MTAREQSEKNDRIAAGFISGGTFLIILLLCFFLTAFTTMDPPPGETFVAVGMADFGSTSNAGGETESEVPSEKPEEVLEESAASTTTNQSSETQEIVTQTSSDVNVNTSKNPSNTTEPKPDPEPEVSGKLGNILDKINDTSGGGGSDGENDGEGNEGAQNGNIEGKGIVQGEGIGWALSGRGMIGKPTLSERPSEKGKVVLDIYVDRNGQVISTARNYPLSTTTSNYLFALAEKAAKKATFTVRQDAPPKQKGSMTFNFELK